MTPKPQANPGRTVETGGATDAAGAQARSPTQLLYDGECPLCNRLALSYKAANPDLEIIDARAISAARAGAEARRLDLNEGMVLVAGERYYYAADALARSATTLRLEGPFGWCMRRLFRDRSRTQALYPWLLRLRKLLLRLTGKSPLQANCANSVDAQKPAVGDR